MKNSAFFGLQSDEEFVEITLMIEIKYFQICPSELLYNNRFIL
jgi:hypothetical protein